MSETTIFPVLLQGKVHSAFLMSEDTDTWATKCGLPVPNGNDVKHGLQVLEVECEDCVAQIERARNLR